jgi:TM2 domain-containing membrane protein YozV
MAKEKELSQPMPPVMAWLPAVALGWLIPGSGHMLLKRTGRGIILFVTIGLTFVCGLLMRGAMFTPQSGDLLTTLINTGGFVGNVLSGLFYILTVSLGYAQADQAGAVHDYGTKFLVTAGLLNLLAITDAYDIAARRKE